MGPLPSTGRLQRLNPGPSMLWAQPRYFATHQGACYSAAWCVCTSDALLQMSQGTQGQTLAFTQRK